MIPISAQIECVERELRFRAKVYPKLIERGRMTREQANDEQAAMRAVLESLRRLQKSESLF